MASSKINKKEVKAQKKVPVKNGVKNKPRRDGIGLLTFLLASVSGAMAITIVLLMTILSTNEKYLFFGIDETNNFVKLVDFSNPTYKTSVVSNWVTEALVATFDFNYTNMGKHLEEESKKWFTESGSDALVASLQRDNYFADVINKKAIVQLNTLQNPIFIKQRKNPQSGKDEWIFQVPVMITYIKREKDPEVQTALITLSVEKRSFHENSKGLGINKLLITED